MDPVPQDQDSVESKIFTATFSLPRESFLSWSFHKYSVGRKQPGDFWHPRSLLLRWQLVHRGHPSPHWQRLGSVTVDEPYQQSWVEWCDLLGGKEFCRRKYSLSIKALSLRLSLALETTSGSIFRPVFWPILNLARRYSCCLPLKRYILAIFLGDAVAIVCAKTGILLPSKLMILKISNSIFTS